MKLHDLRKLIQNGSCEFVYLINKEEIHFPTHMVGPEVEDINKVRMSTMKNFSLRSTTSWGT